MYYGQKRGINKNLCSKAESRLANTDNLWEEIKGHKSTDNLWERTAAAIEIRTDCG